MAYYNLKRELAMRVSKEEYTEAKAPYIEGVLASAMRDPEGKQRMPGDGGDPDGRL